MAPNRHRRQHQAGVARRLAFEMAASAMIGEGMRCRIFAVIALGLLAFDVSTAASAWPDRSIKIIVPFVAGAVRTPWRAFWRRDCATSSVKRWWWKTAEAGGGVIGMSAVAGAPADG